MIRRWLNARPGQRVPVNCFVRVYKTTNSPSNSMSGRKFPRTLARTRTHTRFPSWISVSPVSVRTENAGCPSLSLTLTYYFRFPGPVRGKKNAAEAAEEPSHVPQTCQRMTDLAVFSSMMCQSKRMDGRGMKLGMTLAVNLIPAREGRHLLLLLLSRYRRRVQEFDA